MSQNMPYESINQPGFFVAGIAVRTTNENARAQTDMAGLWAKFISGNIAGQILSRVSDDLYCVYTDYENDYTGWYTAVLGCRILSPDDGGGMFTAQVPAGTYRLYKPEGELPGCVSEAWQQIWLDGRGRSYIADYDLYRSGGVEIYVGAI
jgi:predicted transcriptional regulator YdeE